MTSKELMYLFFIFCSLGHGDHFQTGVNPMDKRPPSLHDISGGKQVILTKHNSHKTLLIHP